MNLCHGWTYGDPGDMLLCPGGSVFVCDLKARMASGVHIIPLHPPPTKSFDTRQ